jgi:hypothetical protein
MNVVNAAGKVTSNNNPNGQVPMSNLPPKWPIPSDVKWVEVNGYPMASRTAYLHESEENNVTS